MIGNSNQILAWLVFSYLLIQFYQLLRHHKLVTGKHYYLPCALLCLLVVGSRLFPAIHGYVALVSWLTFIFAPALLQKSWFVQQERGCYSRAYVLSCLLDLLSFGAYSQQRKFSKAFYLLHRGSEAQGAELLAQIGSFKDEWGTVARYSLFALKGEFKAIVDDYALVVGLGRREIGAEVFVLRALLELRQFDRAFALLENLGSMVRESTWLMAWAHLGRLDLVEQLLAGRLKNLEADRKKLYLAIAYQARGEIERARLQYEQLIKSGDGVIKIASRAHLGRLLSIQNGIAYADQDLVAKLEKQFCAQLELNQLLAPASAPPYATIFLIAINFLVFAVKLVLDHQARPRAIYETAGLYVPYVLNHDQWWRVITAMFLHVDGTHLLMNMLALLVLAPFVEASLGIWKFILLYFVAGIGAFIVLVVLVKYGISEQNYIVGASGAIAGLVGANVVLLLKGVRSAQVKSRLRGFAFIVVFQMVFDLLVPQVSFWGHLFGLLIGALTALLLSRYYCFCSKSSLSKS